MYFLNALVESFQNLFTVLIVFGIDILNENGVLGLEFLVLFHILK